MQTAGYNLYRARRRTEERQRPTPPAHKTSRPTTARRHPATKSHACAKRLLAQTTPALTSRRREGAGNPNFATRRLWRNWGHQTTSRGGLGGRR